jgi:hypothetical protein
MSFENAQERGRPISIKDEGLTLNTNISSIDFVGSGVSGSNIGDNITETINGDITSSVSKTYAELTSMVSGSTLVPGQTYFISDKNIYVTATTTNQFATEGFYKYTQGRKAWGAIKVSGGFGGSASIDNIMVNGDSIMGSPVNYYTETETWDDRATHPYTIDVSIQKLIERVAYFINEFQTSYKAYANSNYLVIESTSVGTASNGFDITGEVSGITLDNAIQMSGGTNDLTTPKIYEIEYDFDNDNIIMMYDPILNNRVKQRQAFQATPVAATRYFNFTWNNGEARFQVQGDQTATITEGMTFWVLGDENEYTINGNPVYDEGEMITYFVTYETYEGSDGTLYTTYNTVYGNTVLDFNWDDTRFTNNYFEDTRNYRNFLSDNSFINDNKIESGVWGLNILQRTSSISFNTGKYAEIYSNDLIDGDKIQYNTMVGGVHRSGPEYMSKINNNYLLTENDIGSNQMLGGSWIMYSTMTNGSQIESLIMMSTGNIVKNSFSSTFFASMQMDDRASFTNNTFTGGTLFYSNTFKDDCFFSTNTLTGVFFADHTITSWDINNSTLTNVLWEQDFSNNLYWNGEVLLGTPSGAGSGLILSIENVMARSIQYGTRVKFAGGAGTGLVNDVIHLGQIRKGNAFETVFLYATALVGTGASIKIGITTDDDCILQSTAISALENGTRPVAIPLKFPAGDLESIILTVTGATITSGTLYAKMEGIFTQSADSVSSLATIPFTVGAGLGTTAANGMRFGSDTTANLYRSAAGVIKSDGAIYGVGGLIGITGQFNTIYPIADNDLTIQTRNGSTARNIIFKSIGSTPTETARFDTNGRLGIGLTAPAKLLDVYGKVRIGQSINAVTTKTLDITGNINFDSVVTTTNTQLNAITRVEGTAGNIVPGKYYYAVVFYTAEGDTGNDNNLYSTLPSITIAGTSKIELAVLPTSTDPRVIGRKIYRSMLTTGGGVDDYYYLYNIATIADNTTLTYSDNIANLDAAGKLAAPDWFYNKNNTTAGVFYNGSSKMLQLSKNLTGVGYGVFNAVTRATTSVAVGSLAFTALTSGSDNTAIGHGAGVSLQDGGQNNFFGYAAGQGIVSGSNNVAMGNNALRGATNTDGAGNIAIGTASLMTLLAGNQYNTAIGYYSGYQAQGSTTSYGRGNIFLGFEAGRQASATDVGSNNVIIGSSTGKALGTGARNVMIGYNLNLTNPNTSDQLNIGNLIFATGMSGTGTTVSTGSVGIGIVAPTYKLDVRGTAAADGIRSAMGFDIYQVPDPTTLSGVVSAGGSVDTGDHWYGVTFTTAVGETHVKYTTAVITTTAGNNTVTLTIPVSTDPRVTGRKIYRTRTGVAQYGERLLATIANNIDVSYVDTTADSALPDPSGIVYFKPNTTSKNLTINGTQSLTIDTNGTFLGLGAGASLTTGGRNVFIGSSAGSAATTTQDTIAIGHSAGSGVLTGSGNIFIGAYNGRVATGTSNTGLGAYNLFSLTSGTNNVALGRGAGYSLTTASSNVFAGYFAGYYETGSNKIIFDNLDRTSEALGRSSALFYGVTHATLASQILALGGGGKVGINTIAPNATLHVFGTGEVMRIGDDTSTNAYMTFSNRGGFGLDASTGLRFQGTSTRPIVFAIHDTWGSGEVARFDTSGNLGIGTASPTTIFSVKEKSGNSDIGGIMIKLTNKTGANSVKGTVVYADPAVDNAFEINPIDGDMPIGVVYTDGIADGSECWVVVAGIAEVLLVDSVATTRSYVAYSSGTTAGRIDTSATVPAALVHFREIGHTLESKGAGTNVLVKCVLHFN